MLCLDAADLFQFLCAVPLHGRLDRRTNHDHAARDLLGGPRVSLHQDRRERQHVPYVVEPIALIIDREIVSGAKVERQKIANRVVVFDPIKPARRSPGPGPAFGPAEPQ